jgi:hypothetical protein
MARVCCVHSDGHLGYMHCSVTNSCNAHYLQNAGLLGEGFAHQSRAKGRAGHWYAEWSLSVSVQILLVLFFVSLTMCTLCLRDENSATAESIPREADSPNNL